MRKEYIVSGSVPFLRGREGVFWMDYLTHADQIFPGNSMLTVNSWEDDTAVRLDTKSWFADTGFNASESILCLLSPFNNRVAWY